MSFTSALTFRPQLYSCVRCLWLRCLCHSLKCTFQSIHTAEGKVQCQWHLHLFLTSILIFLSLLLFTGWWKYHAASHVLCTIPFFLFVIPHIGHLIFLSHIFSSFPTVLCLPLHCYVYRPLLATFSWCKHIVCSLFATSVPVCIVYLPDFQKYLIWPMK